MSTQRGYVGTDISADTGEVVVLASPIPGGFHVPPGTQEDIVTLRLRLKTHTAQDPYIDGQYLVTVRWSDGSPNDTGNEWNTTLDTTEDLTDPLHPLPNFSETGQEIWMDASRDLTIQVKPFGPQIGTGGTIDVLLDYVEL